MNKQGMKQANLITRKIVAGAIMLLYFLSVGLAYLSHENFHAHSKSCGQAYHHDHSNHDNSSCLSKQGNNPYQWQANSHLCEWFKYTPPQITTQETTLVNISEVCWTVQAAPMILPPSKKIIHSCQHRGPPTYYI
ncbi:hypothetical protein K5X82_13180 [Halosquirtibacter xylanolyticus]|uniref:hypothetical protein n=1 Tax=Halosquirtibacter xylanolyticus TaxID=3374599 RepID=UPI003748AF76|nr:hypothetical protein K5X82_13180 [Prolixibacteraceae bacterium]